MGMPSCGCGCLRQPHGAACDQPDPPTTHTHTHTPPTSGQHLDCAVAHLQQRNVVGASSKVKHQNLDSSQVVRAQHTHGTFKPIYTTAPHPLCPALYTTKHTTCLPCTCYPRINAFTGGELDVRIFLQTPVPVFGLLPVCTPGKTSWVHCHNHWAPDGHGKQLSAVRD
jgi:hypothetical protein